MMKKTLYLTCIIVASCASCLRLDSNLYNPTPLDEYQLDDYDGEKEIDLPSYYDIASSKVELFTLQSQADNEDKSTTIWALYIGDQSRITTDTIIMYCHGNARHMDSYYPRTKLLANTGYKHRFGVMMIDYRGYGMSEGASTEEGLYSDVNSALIWLKSKGLSSDRLIIYGYSMGTAPATELTANPRALIPSKIILEAPFASAEVMAQDAGLLSSPGSFFTDVKIDNAEEIKKITAPFLWFHGTDDAFLNMLTHGEIVAKNYGGMDKTEIRVVGATHTNVPQVYGFENYLFQIKTLIEK